MGGIAEILPEKNLCPADNPEALARHIEMAMTIPAAMAEDAKTQAESAKVRFDAGIMSRKVTGFYEQLLPGPARSC